jgi:hypothetical protein
MVVTLPALPAFERIFVGGLRRGTTDVQLRTAFAFVGVDVGNIEFVLDRVTGIQRGFAFVALQTPLDLADTAFGQLRSATLEGQLLHIQAIATRRATRDRRSRT